MFPGFIDPHTHIYLPFMGTYSKDTYETGSKAALIGGTTTIFDMCCPARDMPPSEGFRVWTEQSAGKSACDYSFHMGVTGFDAARAAQLREIVSAGVSSFKIFLAYKGAFGIDDTELYHTLRLARELGVVVAAHCENETLVAERQQELLASGVRGPEGHHESRPPLVEAEGVHHLMTFAQLTGAHVYIVHLSCEEALREAVAARLRGVNVRVETLIQYLLLDSSDAERADFEGAKYVMSPPLREKRNQAVLWSGLREGLIDTVATDHAPFDFGAQKVMGRDDFTKIPNGIPALEDRVNLLFTHGVKTGGWTCTRSSTSPARTPRRRSACSRARGRSNRAPTPISSFTTPNYRGTISARTQAMNLDYSAFEGWPVEGRPSVVTVRGEVAVRDGQFVGTVGRGKFLARQPGIFEKQKPSRQLRDAGREGG